MPSLDSISVSVFFASWIAYAWYADYRGAHGAPSLLAEVNGYRREWMSRLVHRENRVADVTILRSLSHSATFFASTTLLILGGLFALLGTTDRIVEVVADLPYSAKAPELVWELKILNLIAIFVYSFFKFTWANRQFSFSAILVGAAPLVPANSELDGDAKAFIDRGALLITYAGESFNQGLRAYYFAAAAVAWFFHPIALMGATALVVGVLYAREFRSKTLAALRIRKGHGG